LWKQQKENKMYVYPILLLNWMSFSLKTYLERKGNKLILTNPWTEKNNSNPEEFEFFICGV